ncbi:MAG: peptide chain release factor N(5)-glutamine methyltransferase [Gammaproteobacteria bacterium]|nr:peptide chain release factor N(5)-glutamine methyltransferase [Gammaproteobacteria bacterium]
MSKHTVEELLAAAAARLAPSSSSARLDAELLLAQAMRFSRPTLLARPAQPVDDAAAAGFEALVARRSAGEPIAYLVGHKAFWTLEIAVDPRVLVPRPETELLVELAIERIPAGEATRVLDLGTGSGAVAIAIASERPDADVVGVDASAGALTVARDNAASVEDVGVEFREGSWWGPVAGERFDVIVSNPPYLAADDPHLADPALACEPRAALVAGPGGLEAIAEIAAGALAHLAPGGWLIVEHGFEQGEAVRKLFADAGLREVETRRDLAGLERATLGRAAG